MVEETVDTLGPVMALEREFNALVDSVLSPQSTHHGSDSEDSELEHSDAHGAADVPQVSVQRLPGDIIRGACGLGGTMGG